MKENAVEVDREALVVHPVRPVLGEGRFFCYGGHSTMIEADGTVITRAWGFGTGERFMGPDEMRERGKKATGQ